MILKIRQYSPHTKAPKARQDQGREISVQLVFQSECPKDSPHKRQSKPSLESPASQVANQYSISSSSSFAWSYFSFLMVDLVQRVPQAPWAIRPVKPVAQLDMLSSAGASDRIPSSRSHLPNDAAHSPGATPCFIWNKLQALLLLRIYFTWTIQEQFWTSHCWNGYWVSKFLISFTPYTAPIQPTPTTTFLFSRMKNTEKCR